jgi:hypothetical protein
MSVELNRTLFNARLRSLIDSWSVCDSDNLYVQSQDPDMFVVQSAGKNDDYATVADCDALLILAGDPAAEDEVPKKSTAFQVCTLVRGQTHWISCNVTDMAARL